MALVGHISGSTQTNSAIGVSGSVIIASKPDATFPSLDSGIKFLVDEASLFTSTVVSSGSLTLKDSSGLPTFNVDASNGNLTFAGTLSATAAAASFALGLSGSLTKLTDGTSYLAAGSNITIASSSNGQVIISATAAASGDVVGPASATDNAVARYDGTTGKLIQDSGVTIDDSGNILGAGTLAVISSITGSSTLTIAGSAILNGGIVADGGVFSVADTTGNVSTTGTLIAGGLASLNGGIAVDTSAFTVQDTTGNVFTAGTLGVVSSITGSSTLTITGDALLNGGTSTTTLGVSDLASFNGDVDLGNAVTDSITFVGRADSDFLPIADSTYNLGSATNRWANVYTGDLHLRNDRGDYTLIEEEDMLTIRFNKTGKRYKFLLESVPHLDEEPSLKF